MYTMRFWTPFIVSSTIRWKLETAPLRPMLVVSHSNCPFPGTVNAVAARLFFSNNI